MRPVSIIIMALLTTSLVFGQEEGAVKSDNPFILGGSMNLSFSTNTDVYQVIVPSFGLDFGSFSDEVKSTRFTFSPYIGKELNRHWALGLSLSLGLLKITDDEYNDSIGTQEYVRKDRRYGVGVFGRYQVNPDQKLVGFVQPQVIYNTGTATVELDGSESGESTIDVFSAAIRGGALYALSDNFRLTAGIGVLDYTSTTYDMKDTVEEESSSFGLDLNLESVRFGLELTL